MFVFGVILVRIFPAFFHIRIEYGEIWKYGVALRIKSECEKMREKCRPEQLRLRALFTQCLLFKEFNLIEMFQTLFSLRQEKSFVSGS